jgi:hypothetical protein
VNSDDAAFLEYRRANCEHCVPGSDATTPYGRCEICGRPLAGMTDAEWRALLESLDRIAA